MNVLRIAVAVLVVAAAALIGGPASSASADVPAGVPIQYVTADVFVDSGAKTGVVRCPSGTRVVSSGASAPSSASATLISIAPTADFAAATVTGVAIPGSSGYLQVTVGCVPSTLISEVTSRTVSLPLGAGYHTGVAWCPSGMHACGGGGFFAKPDGTISSDARSMVSNAVSAAGTGWTFAGYTSSSVDRLYIRTQVRTVERVVRLSEPRPTHQLPASHRERAMRCRLHRPLRRSVCVPPQRQRGAQLVGSVLRPGQQRQPLVRSRRLQRLPARQQAGRPCPMHPIELIMKKGRLTS